MAHRRCLSYRGTYSSHRYRQYLLMQFSQRPRPLGLVRLWLALQQTIFLSDPIAASSFHSVGDNALTLARHPVLSDYVAGDHPAECIRSLVQERGGKLHPRMQPPAVASYSPSSQQMKRWGTKVTDLPEGNITARVNGSRLSWLESVLEPHQTANVVFSVSFLCRTLSCRRHRLGRCSATKGWWY